MAATFENIPEIISEAIEGFSWQKFKSDHSGECMIKDPNGYARI
jgi:hypothetical protein